MRRWVALAALLVACGDAAPPSPMPKEIAAVERRLGAPFRGIALAKDGLYYDRTKRSTIADAAAGIDGLVAELTRHRRTLGPSPDPALRDPPAVAMSIVVVPDPSISPALIRAVLETTRRAGWQRVNVKQILTRDGRADLRPVCDLEWSGDRAAADDPDVEIVRLSIYGQLERFWIGLSRVHEFQEIPAFTFDGESRPDYDKLEYTLAEHKRSAFFVERTDAELAVDPEVGADVLLIAMEVACKVGFVDLDVVEPAALAARPQL